MLFIGLIIGLLHNATHSPSQQVKFLLAVYCPNISATITSVQLCIAMIHVYQYLHALHEQLHSSYLPIWLANCMQNESGCIAIAVAPTLLLTIQNVHWVNRDSCVCSYSQLLMSTMFPVRERKATCNVRITGLVHVVLESVLNFNFSESLQALCACSVQLPI